MKILITQAEFKNPPFFFVHDGLERSWYHLLAGHDVIVAPNIPNFAFDRVEWDCLMLTGGNDSVGRHLTENHLYQMADTLGKPIVGFCHGAFAVNDLAAGVNGRIPGHVGADHDIIMEDRTWTVNSFHSQCIAQLAPGFEILAQDIQGHPEAFRHIFKPIWGVVWHPERMSAPVLPQSLANLLRTSDSIF